MFCKKCGFDVTETTDFCPYCREKITGDLIIRKKDIEKKRLNGI
jgi:hypothetical protein